MILLTLNNVKQAHFRNKNRIFSVARDASLVSNTIQVDATELSGDVRTGITTSIALVKPVLRNGNLFTYHYTFKARTGLTIEQDQQLNDKLL